MTNTKFRKRALLSSVAMLLVALVALGSATFAWFTDDPTADAKGLSVKANTSTGLVVLSASEQAAGGDYSHHTVLNCASEKVGGKYVTSTEAVALSPNSQNASGAMFSGQAVDGTAYTGTGAFAASSTGYRSEIIHCKVTGGIESADVKVSSVSWTAGSGNLKNALRVSLFQGSTYLGTWGTSAAASASFIKTAGTYGDSIKDTRAILAQSAEGAATFNCSANGTDVTMYVYLDGEHADCFTDNITTADATLLGNNFEIDFEIAD